jgi:hypothetical protein
VAQLAANICVNRFLASPDARTNLAALHEERAYRRDALIEEGGWTMLADREEPIPGAADLCAEKLAEVELSSLPEVPVAEATTLPTAQAPAVH